MELTVIAEKTGLPIEKVTEVFNGLHIFENEEFEATKKNYQDIGYKSGQSNGIESHVKGSYEILEKEIPGFKLEKKPKTAAELAKAVLEFQKKISVENPEQAQIIENLRKEYDLKTNELQNTLKIIEQKDIENSFVTTASKYVFSDDAKINEIESKKLRASFFAEYEIINTEKGKEIKSRFTGETLRNVKGEPIALEVALDNHVTAYNFLKPTKEGRGAQKPGQNGTVFFKNDDEFFAYLDEKGISRGSNEADVIWAAYKKSKV